MHAPSLTPSISKKALWTGWILTALPVLVLLVSAAMKFAKPAAVLDGFAHLGWPERFTLILGILEIVCTIMYLIPATAVLGAILLTGYFGGATATHLRVGDPFWAPPLLGVLLWLGLSLRDPRVRSLLPVRRL